jgi:hypothetical protein
LNSYAGAFSRRLMFGLHLDTKKNVGIVISFNV